MKKNNYEFTIIVKDKNITEYSHEGDVYVEGRKGSEFTLKFSNNTYDEVLVVPSVDGKSVMDGERATTKSSGYVVSPRSSIEIPGWRLDNDNVAKFVFSEKSKSYAVQTSEPDEELNVGVIGVLVFKKKHAVKKNQLFRGNLTKNIPIQGSGTGFPPFYPYVTTSTMTGNLSASSTLSDTVAVSDNIPDESFDLGTGFGESTSHKVNMTTFERSDKFDIMSIFYDSRKNLEKRGIVIKKDAIANKPTPFALGCKPPKGWVG